MTETSSIWLRPERGARGPASRWTRSDLAGTAIAHADEHGLAAVTMRSMAQSLGTAPASLYRVVRSRHELLELMIDEVIGEFTYGPALTGSGTHGLLTLSRQARAVYRRHPWMIEAHANQPFLGPNAITYLDRALSTLADSPLLAQQKLEAIGVLAALVRMLAANEREAQRSRRSSREWQAATAAHLLTHARDGRHPELAEVLARTAVEPAHTKDLFDRIVLRTMTGLLAEP